LFAEPERLRSGQRYLVRGQDAKNARFAAGWLREQGVDAHAIDE
jgi:hypothetical protein